MLQDLLRRAPLATIMLLGLVGAPHDVAARGGISRPDPASTRQIEELPPEIRKSVARWQSVCGSPLAAHHQFAFHLEGSASRYRFIGLHYELLSCDRKDALCSKEGCLHEVYVSTGGAYRRVLSVQVRDVELTFIDRTAAVEFIC